jgi:hypothetical protein
MALLDEMRSAFGGEIVSPLHITIDRVVTDDVDELVRAVRASLPRLRPVAVRVDGAFFLPSRDRGPEIVKLNVTPDASLARVIAGLRAALRRTGLPSLDADDRSTNVTAVQRAKRTAATEARTWDLPLELFLGDVVILSRLRDPVTYEILDTATIPTTG